MLTFKNTEPRCKMHTMSPQTVLAIGVLREVGQLFQVDIEVTCISDGEHSKRSKHYRGDAFDWKIVGWANGPVGSDLIVDMLKSILGPDFDVIFETGEEPHGHVEYDPKDGPR